MEAIFHKSHPESVHLTIGGKPHLTAEPHHSRPSRFTQTRLDIQRFPHVRQQNADSKSIGLGLSQNGDATISILTAGAGLDWLG